MTPAPQFSLPQQEVVRHRQSHLQVIACAGSGKTESISQRIAGLIQEGAKPESIVAFTFTERAAAELKECIISRSAELSGDAIKGSLARMYVGTIRGYSNMPSGRRFTQASWSDSFSSAGTYRTRTSGATSQECATSS